MKIVAVAICIIALVAANPGPTDWEGTWAPDAAAGPWSSSLFHLCPAEESDSKLTLFARFVPANEDAQGLPGIVVADLNADFTSAFGNYYLPGYPLTPVNRLCTVTAISFTYVDDHFITLESRCHNDGIVDRTNLTRVNDVRPTIAQCAHLANFNVGDSTLAGTYQSNFRCTGNSQNTIMTLAVDKNSFGEYFRGESSLYVDLRRDVESAENAYYTVRVHEDGRVGTGVMFYKSSSKEIEYYVLVYRLLDGTLGMMRYDYTEKDPEWEFEVADIYSRSITPPTRDINQDLAPLVSGVYANGDLILDQFVCVNPIGVEGQKILSSTYNFRGVMYGIRPLDQVNVFTGRFNDADRECNSGEIQIVVSSEDDKLILFYNCDDTPLQPSSVESVDLIMRVTPPAYLCARGVGYSGQVGGITSATTPIDVQYETCVNATTRSYTSSFRFGSSASSDDGFGEGVAPTKSANTAAGDLWLSSGVAGRQIQAAFSDSDGSSKIIDFWEVYGSNGDVILNSYNVLSFNGPANETRCVENEDLRPPPPPPPPPSPNPSPFPNPSPTPAQAPTTPTPVTFVIPTVSSAEFLRARNGFIILSLVLFCVF